MPPKYTFHCPECNSIVEFVYSPISVPLKMAGKIEDPVTSVYLTCEKNHVNQYFLADAEKS
jgi:hypothetical protein